jgi:integrase
MVVADMTANGRKSIKRVELAIRSLHAGLGRGTPARDVDEARITEYITERLAAKAARATVNRELAALRRGFRLAERSRRLARVPHVALLHEDNARRGFFELEQLQAVLAHLPSDLQPVVEAAYETGWRVHSELLTRQWRHVDLKAGWLRLEPGEGKSGRGRMFPLTAALRRVLEAQRALTDKLEREEGRVVPWVFHRAGVPIRTFRRAWLTACRLAGLPGKIPHDFRRTAVRNLERAGVPRSAAKALVGHLTDSVYQRYAIVDETMLVDAGEKLGRLRR